MHDNAGIHTSRVVHKFLADYYITAITWPPYSPDLNSIEHLWWHLKKRMHKFYPQFNNYSRAEDEWEAFCEALKECWRGIPERLIKRLILSMPRCMAGKQNTEASAMTTSKNHQKILCSGGVMRRGTFGGSW
jgi:hypothetical protein